MTELIITSTALIIVVLALRHFLKGRISLRLQYALWALVLLRLLVPVNLPQSPISVLNAVPAGETAATASDYEPLTSINEGLVNTAQAGDDTSLDMNAAPDTHKTVPNWSGLLSLVWYAGIAVVGLSLLISNLSFSRKLKRAKKELPLCNYRLKVYIVKCLSCPCLYGLFSPAVYLTPEVARDKTRLDHVLAHELCHYRHGDHIWSALRSLCLAVYWFNPFVWLAAGVSRRDAELACDESTIMRLGEENRMEYGRTLIGLTCTKRSAIDLLCCATAMKDSKKGIQERVALIAKKPKTTVCTLAAIVLILAVAVGCTFTGADSGETAQSDATPPAETADSAVSPSAASPSATTDAPTDAVGYVGGSGVAVSDPSALYTVYDGRNPLSKEELQEATLLSIVNVDSLDFLHDAPNLTHIRAGGTANDAASVTGDIGALGGLTKLQSVIFSNSNVTGDIASLNALEELQELSMSYTHISGDIGALNKLENLRVMYLASDGVTGDLGALDGMSALEQITLSGSGITGSLGALAGLSNLQGIVLISTPNVTGDIGMIKGMHLAGITLYETGIAIDLGELSGISGLIRIDLESDNITGDLSALGEMYDLVSISLSGKDIEGDLNALSGLSSLRGISLISTPNVTGDIGTLKGCAELTRIMLDETNITGDLSDLSGFPSLISLTLLSPEVTGDLGDLGGFKDISYISLASPNITGDLEALSKLYLYKLSLNCPNVTGDLSALGKLTHLTSLDLSTADVAGDIGALSGLTSLKRLDLSSTGVSGDLAALDGLTELTDIDVTGTNVTGLTDIDVTGTNVTGQ